ncbi:KN motif and ankyrin repeat domain-containing protein 4 isoform X2 [Contarinia nasturtii]|uniref:KN motif and ankyrin repeat domain-containing protein 4 isoform X2 n=1 Tax=Contarinia nasturtii TaxID=265458 RepID=UPI0012D3B4A1|nr:KN motif and ankyrin repeat domain-containing protein 4 isoform X2 [Contarinia nasturtii]
MSFVQKTYKRIKSRLSFGSCISGHESYDNEKQVDLENVHYSPSSTERSPVQYTQRATSHNVHQQNIFTEEIHEEIVHHVTETKQSEPKQAFSTNDAELSPLNSDVFNVEIDKLSLANRGLSDQLQSVRNQLSDNLNRVRDFEERVKLIPKLQLELSVEKAENRDLHLKLRALENALEKKKQYERQLESELAKAKVDSTTTTTITETTVSERGTIKPPHRVCATSLESLNIRFSPNSFISSNESYKNGDSSFMQPPPPSTQNVGCMTAKTVSRDVGTVTIPLQIPTRTMAINTDISERNPFVELQKKPVMHSVSVQSDHETVEIPKRTVATITDREPSPPPPVQKYSVAVMAIPSVRTSSCMARPEIRSIGVDNIFEKNRTRSFGTDPIKHLDESTAIDSPISLKLLDVPKSIALLASGKEPVKPVEKPKEFRSVGIQKTPNVMNKYSQCKEKLIEPPPPPKIPTQTEATDTSDLTLHINRGVNTDAVLPKKNRLTNTDQILTEEKSTNTFDTKKTITANSATNTDLTESKKEILKYELERPQEPKCYDCLAKIEIKQRTIIKNPNKKESNINIKTAASTSMAEEMTTTSKTVTESTTSTTTKTTTESQNESLQSTTQSTDTQSRIPRPTTLNSPRMDRKFTRQNTYTIPSSSSSSTSPPPTFQTDATDPCPAEVYLSSCSAASAKSKQIHSNLSQTSSHRICSEDRTVKATSSVDSTVLASNSSDASKKTLQHGTKAESHDKSIADNDEPEPLWSNSMKSSSTYSHLVSSARPRQKITPSKEMQAALKVINDSLLKGQHLATTLKNANKIVQKEWFRISSTETAQPFEVEDYLDCFEEFSPNLLKYMVNLTDANGNTCMHYAVSHGNFDVVSILLDSKVCDINKTNNAGYTCVMLVSLAKLDAAEHQTVVQRLFQMSDVNVRAKKHSQTALMLATSHGNYQIVRMLLEAGADINIQDEDGSTALMCAAEHGRMDIIKIILAQPDCDSTIQDLDGSTALKISLEAGYRDIGVLLYAHEYMIKNKSPYTSLRSGGRSRKASSSLTSSTNVLHSHSNAEGGNTSGSKMDNSSHDSQTK